MLWPTPPPPLLPPPHAVKLPTAANASSANPIMDNQARRRAGMPKNRMQASTVAPGASHGTPGRFGKASALVVGGVVEMVRVAVRAEEPVMLTELVEPKLNVGRSDAPARLDVMAAVSVTSPVKPPAGVTVMVEVFPDFAPGVTVTAVPVTVNPLTLRASDTDGEITPLLALMVRLYFPPGVEEVVTISKAS